jgi:acetyl-CoA carboxylase carboxyltransferase component
MAKVILSPIGSDLSLDAAAEDNRARQRALADALYSKRAATRLGWGEQAQARTRARGKMTAWERVEALADPGTSTLPINTFVNDGERFGEAPGRTSPSAGVITGFARVHDRWVVVIANDNTVASGSWWPRTPEKIIRAQEVALRLKLPVVYLVDCSGLFLPEQGRTFPGKRGAGHIFAKNSQLSAAGVPQLAGVFGDCIAGGGYMPIISDKVLMTEQAYMVIAGAALIQGAKSQNLSSLGIGGADVHVHLSGCADERAPDDAACIARLRAEVATLASSAAQYYRHGADPAPPHFSPDELEAIIPARASQPYDVRQVIARLTDRSLFWEVMPETGQEVVTGVARINGLYVGIIANEQGLIDHPEEPGKKRPGGILYREGVAKVAIFSRACNDDGIPLVWLQDISGFDIGTEAEKQGLLGYGSSLIYTNATNQTPMLTVLLRKASGAGYYAMAGLPYEPVLQLSTPITRLAVMEGRTLAIAAFNTKLDDNFQIATDDPAERAKVEAGMRDTEARIERDMDPYAAARQMDTDEVISLPELRAYLEAAVEMTYQAQASRRIKNPRIWSLHDLAVITRPPRA